MDTAKADSTIALAFMAHPDDAEILCGGTLIRLSDAGWQIHIATCTAGDCGSATLAPDEIAAVRQEEARVAAAQCGGTYHCLCLHDLKVAYTPDAVARVLALFRQVNPSLVITHPRHDYMLDHEQCHLLARAASFGFAMPNASDAPLPPNAAVPHLYYADALDAHDPYSGEAPSYSTVIDITTVMDRKAAMLSCHSSQREWLRSHHDMDEYIDAMKRHGTMRGEAAGVGFAEAFSQHRGHAYPQEDLLARTLNQGDV